MTCILYIGLSETSHDVKKNKNFACNKESCIVSNSDKTGGAWLH